MAIRWVFNPFTGKLDAVQEAPSGAGDVFHTNPLTAGKLVQGDGTDYVDITGLTVDAMDNLSGVNTLTVTDISTTQQNLNLEPGVDVQAFDQSLADIAGLTLSEDDIFKVDGSGNIVNLAKGAEGTFLGISGGSLVYSTPAGGGDVTGPASAGADGNIVLFDGTTGKLIKDSTAQLSDYLAVANDLSDLNDASTARANLGLGTAATAASSDFLAVANDLSDLNDASTARTNLSLVIGTNVQAWDADLDAIAALSSADGNFIVGSATGWTVESGAAARGSLGLGSSATHPIGDFLQTANDLSDLNDASTARTNLEVAIGSDVQAWSANLDTIAGLSDADGNFIVGSATGWVVESGATVRTSLGLGSAATAASTNFLQVANDLSDLNDESAARTNIGLAIGTDVQAFDQALADISGLTLSSGDIFYVNALGNIVNLAKGSDTEVLTLVSGLPSWEAAGGGGIGGSTGATDNAILRADGTGGSTLQNSLAKITDAGEILLENGTATNPSIAFNSETNMGLYRSGSGIMRLVQSGSPFLIMSTSTFQVFNRNFQTSSTDDTNLFGNVSYTREAISSDSTTADGTFFAGVTDTSAERTVTLRIPSSGKKWMYVVDETLNAGTNNIVVISQSSKNINGQSEYRITKDGGSAAFYYVDGTVGWIAYCISAPQEQTPEYEATINLGIDYTSGRFQITGFDGTALSDTNLAKVRVNQGDGTSKILELNLPYKFDDDSHASIHDLEGWHPFWNSGDNWNQDRPYFIGVGQNDTATSAPCVFITQNPKMTELPAAGVINVSGTINDNTQNSVFLLEISDGAGGWTTPTIGDYDGNPCVIVGSFRMKVTDTSNDDQTVSALDSQDGIGQFQAGRIFTVPAGVAGAASGTYILSNAGTEPAFNSVSITYRIEKDGRPLYHFNAQDCGTAGVGAQTLQPILPYALSSGQQEDSNMGGYTAGGTATLTLITATAASGTAYCSTLKKTGATAAMTNAAIALTDSLQFEMNYQAF